MEMSEINQVVLQDRLDDLREAALEGEWKKVTKMYNTYIEFHTMEIDKSRGTALHVAVNDGREDVVTELVDAIMKHDVNASALESKNERGDTPLHLAAMRGFRGMCERIIGKDHERKPLIHVDNNLGETPLFLAALTCQKQTFAYLWYVYQDQIDWIDLIRDDGDTILHCAIHREFFDLAVIILSLYPKLREYQNNKGFSPLKVLATRPSAFKSGRWLKWWKEIIYHCIHVDDLNVEETLNSYLEKKDETAGKPLYDWNFPQNYLTCYQFFTVLPRLAVALVRGASNKEQQNFKKGEYKIKIPAPAELRRIEEEKREEEKKLKVQATNEKQQQVKEEQQPEKDEHKIKIPQKVAAEKHRKGPTVPKEVPANYVTCHQFLKLAYVHTLHHLGVGIHKIRDIKQKHKWGAQLLNALMETPYESYTGSGGQPFGVDSVDETNPFEYINKLRKEEEDKDKDKDNKKDEDGDEDAKEKIDMKETAILTAARNGIVEMVTMIQSKIPSALYDTTSDKKNVFLMAVKKRQPLVIEALRKQLPVQVTENLIQAVDDEGKTVLHLAAKATSIGKGWPIAGSAMQMMWDVKWFQYIKHHVPDHFIFRDNKYGKTAVEIFKVSHEDLINKSGEWLKDTAESCSVVAALIAGVSFATASTVPGGTIADTGKPALEGQPAFDAFAIASLIGLCVSVTALIMFLSILTSRKQAHDFRRSLPLKLLLGLSSLFVSIAAMFVSFCSGHFFVLKDKYKQILFPIYAATCLPVTFYAIAQFPLYTDLLNAILMRVPPPSDKGGDL